MIDIRPAVGKDAEEIREIFLACYGTHYPYEQFYDIEALTRMIYSEDTIILVAEETSSGRVLGTASVLLEIGASSDLMGEMGRLAVHPDARAQGIGKRLMSERLERAKDRLHLAVVDGRTQHPYTLRIAEGHQFCVVGFLPEKMRLSQRESLVLLVRYFNDSLQLRKNNPRILPEVAPIAHMALENCGLSDDAILDEESPSYPGGAELELEELTTLGYAPLLRIERGRVRNREVFGPMRLHYGFFKLRACRSRYLIAREGGRVVGAIGFIQDPLDQVVRVFELISLHDPVIPFLLSSLVSLCRKQEVHYVEIDVSAYAPSMQRALLELGFLPMAYIPAQVFHEVERLDIVKMGLLLSPIRTGELALSPKATAMANVVLQSFRQREVLPQIAQAVSRLPLFQGMSKEQIHRIAGLCSVRQFQPGEIVFEEGSSGQEMFIILDGEVDIQVGADRTTVGSLGVGEHIGEMALLSGSLHTATVVSRLQGTMAVLHHKDITALNRCRPDTGLLIYRNLAIGLGAKLQRLDQAILSTGAGGIERAEGVVG